MERDAAERRRTPEAPFLLAFAPVPALSGEQRLKLVLHALTRELGRRPSVRDYRECRERDPELPSFTEVYDAYGSWRAALEAAGLTEADEQSPAWRDLILARQPGEEVPLEALLELVDQVDLLKEVSDEQGYDIWSEAEWVPDDPPYQISEETQAWMDQDAQAWADRPLTRDQEPE